MGLFGNRGEKQLAKAAAAAEAERLTLLSVAQLAAEVMAAFGANGMEIKSGYQQGPMQVVAWLAPGAPTSARQPLLGPVIEALGVLESAGMLSRSSFGSSGRGSTYRPTRLGETALAEGTVAGHARLSERGVLEHPVARSVVIGDALDAELTDLAPSLLTPARAQVARSKVGSDTDAIIAEVVVDVLADINEQTGGLDAQTRARLSEAVAPAARLLVS